MELETLLSRLQVSAGPQAAEGALALLERILQNVAENPSSPKFRRLSSTSARLQSGLLRHAGALEFLAAAGFRDTGGGLLELGAGSEASVQPALRAVRAHGAAEVIGGADPLRAAYLAAVAGGAQGAGVAELAAISGQPGGPEALQVLEKIVTNVRRYPDSEKYRCVVLSKPAGQRLLPALPLLRVAGFERAQLATGEECVRLGRPDVDVLERVWAMVWWATRPGPGRPLPTATGAMSQLLGAVLGVAVGDALGAPLGGKGPFEVLAAEVDKAEEMCGGGAWGVAPGQPTGNTELMVCLSECLAEAPAGALPADSIALSYGRWGRSAPFRSERACSQAFQRPLSAQELVERARDVNQKATGGGALARCMPLAALGAARGSPAAAAAQAREEARLSHPDLAVGLASAAYVFTAAQLALSSGDRAAAIGALQRWLEQGRAAARHGGPSAPEGAPRGWTHLSRGAQPPAGQRGGGETEWAPPGEQIVTWDQLAASLGTALSSDEDIPFSSASADALLSGEAGSVDIPLQHAFRHLRRGSSFEVAMRAALAGGGDAATTAAVVGGLVGAAVGVGQIPERWVRAVLESDFGMGQPRPVEYHAGRLPGLLERIFAAGGG